MKFHKAYILVFLVKLVLLGLCCLVLPINAISAVVLHTESFSLNLRDETEYFMDEGLEKKKPLDIEDLLGGERFKSFRRYEVSGWVNKPYWIRIQIVNQNDQPRQAYLETLAAAYFITLYQVNEDGSYSSHMHGRAVPASLEKLKTLVPVFPLVFPANQKTTLYLRFQGYRTLNFDFQLRSYDKYLSSQQWLPWRLALFYGGCLGLILVNLFVYFSSRDVSYLYLVGCASSTIFLNFLWSSSCRILWPQLEANALYISGSVISIIVIFGISFLRSFCMTSKYCPLLDSMLKCLCRAYILAFVFLTYSLLQVYYSLPSLIDTQFISDLRMPVITITIGGMAIVYLMDFIASILCYKRGHRSSKFYVIARCGFLITGIVIVTIILAYSWHLALVIPLLEVGTLWELLFFSFALANHIISLKSTLKKERRYHNITQEEHRSLIKVLEKRVVDRSSQLLLTSQSLKRNIEDLKTTQTELIQVEKMAEIGRLVKDLACRMEVPMEDSFRKVSKINVKLLFLESMVHNHLANELHEIFEFIRHQVTSTCLTLSQSDRIIQTFKHIAVNEVVDDLRQFSLSEYVASLIDGLFKNKSKLRINVITHGNLIIESHQSVIYQIFSRLLDNVILHAYPQDNPQDVNIRMEAINSRIFIYVEDKGIGLSESELACIFDAFYTVAQEQNSTHTGLGLHIVRNLVVHKLEGKIHGESTPGNGLTIVIELPFVIQKKVV